MTTFTLSAVPQTLISFYLKVGGDHSSSFGSVLIKNRAPIFSSATAFNYGQTFPKPTERLPTGPVSLSVPGKIEPPYRVGERGKCALQEGQTHTQHKNHPAAKNHFHRRCRKISAPSTVNHRPSRLRREGARRSPKVSPIKRSGECYPRKNAQKTSPEPRRVGGFRANHRYPPDHHHHHLLCTIFTEIANCVKLAHYITCIRNATI